MRRRLGLGFALRAGCVALWWVLSGCSGTSPLDPWNGSGSSGSGGSSSGSSSGSSTSSGSGGGSGMSSSSGGSGSGSGSASSSSGSGSSGGSGSGSGSGAPDASGGADASAHPDASAAADSGSSDATTAAGDAGGCADEAMWLTPMNAARAAVNAGEPPLVCDPIAAQVAFNYASMCNYAHNANRNTDYTALGGKGGVGENIAAGAPIESIAQAVSSWVGEETSYNHATNTCATGQQCGHYTQIVWKTTTGVGCAHVSCTTNSPFGTTGGGRWDFSVCDYSPPGNVVGQSPY